MATCKPLCHTPYKFMLNWIYSCATILKSRVWRRCLIASGGHPSAIQQLALQPINYIEIHVTNSLSQHYKSKDFKIFKKTTRFQLTMLSIGLRGQWKWALSINPLEAWSAWSDSNRQGLRRRILSAVCLAISSHADIHLKPTSYLIAISSISSWMMLSIPIPFIMPNRLTDVTYLALLSIRRSQSLL